MVITYSILSGTPCEIPVIERGYTIKDAIADFRSYIRCCDRIGNPYQDAALIIEPDADIPRALYNVGPRGGIVRSSY